MREDNLMWKSVAPGLDRPLSRVGQGNLPSEAFEGPKGICEWVALEFTKSPETPWSKDFCFPESVKIAALFDRAKSNDSDKAVAGTGWDAESFVYHYSFTLDPPNGNLNQLTVSKDKTNEALLTPQVPIGTSIGKSRNKWTGPYPRILYENYADTSLTKPDQTRHSITDAKVTSGSQVRAASRPLQTSNSL
jgi:hypothetical protein